MLIADVPGVKIRTCAPRMPPLCVDLDGTLVKTDTLWETVLVLIKTRPWCVLVLPFWLLSGKARFKERIASRASLDWSSLPYTAELLDHLRRAYKAGRKLVLVSACDRWAAYSIAEHLGLFNDVIASDGVTNVKGGNKARILVERYGLGGFDYVGNGRADFSVWEAARDCLVANAPARVVRRLARETSNPPREFAPPVSRLAGLIRAMRPHQWSKNVLVFVPIVAAHAFLDWPAVVGAALMFLAWCLVASAIYLGNDLLDLEADRRHPAKRLRPFASGDVPLLAGIVMAPALLVLGLGIAFAVSSAAAGTLLLYALVAVAYSWHLKKRPLVDVFTLAFLFTIRVVGGGLASGYAVTSWLLAFTGFLFLGLAFLKRCSELFRVQTLGWRHLGFRGYGVADLPILQMFGVASAFIAITVLALYLNTAVAEAHYRSPAVLWAVGPFLLLWLCRLWLAMARGEMEDDPLVYSMKDRVSWIFGACVLVTILVATIGLR